MIKKRDLTKHCHRLSREAVSLLLGGHQTSCLDMVPGNLLLVALLQQGLDQMASRHPFQPQLFSDSVLFQGLELYNIL